MAGNEYISVEEIKKHYNDVLNTEYVDDCATGFKAGLLAVMSLSITDVESVKHGHWYKENLGIAMMWRCSNCRSMYGFYTENPAYKYCPDCGAKMDEQEDDE